jgi:hypothetical protein
MSGLLMLSNIVFHYYMVCTTDPGSPLNDSGGDWGQPMGCDDARSGDRSICKKCNCIKPERAHHCSVCKRCIKKFDHHCPCKFDSGCIFQFCLC